MSLWKCHRRPAPDSGGDPEAHKEGVGCCCCRDMVGLRGFLAELVVGSSAGFAQGHQPHGMRYSGVSWMFPSRGQLVRDRSEGQSMVRQARQGTITAVSVLKSIRDGPSRLLECTRDGQSRLSGYPVRQCLGLL